MVNKAGGYISKITFNNGKDVDINKNDIIIFVGPNNAGKSQSLKDIYALSAETAQTTVISNIKIEKYKSNLVSFLETLDTPKIGSDYKEYNVLGKNIRVRSYTEADSTRMTLTEIFVKFSLQILILRLVYLSVRQLTILPEMLQNGILSIMLPLLRNMGNGFLITTKKHLMNI